MIPVWGFGGRVFGEVSHCFSLTFDEGKPEVRGVDGILQVYDNALKNVTLSGPTLFSQIIQTANVIADQPYSQESQNYNILLILTDGVINDMPATIQAIKQASKVPLSIIIVGVGEADFTDMQKLDGDDEKDVKVRDIVQFVPFRDYTGHMTMLAKETLREVPIQFMSFMKSKGILPNAPRKAAPARAVTVEMESSPLSASSPSTTASSSTRGAPSAPSPAAADIDDAPPAFGDVAAVSSDGPPTYGNY